MAYYNDPKGLEHTTYADPFKIEYKPGDRAPLSGIYKCIHCGDEIAHNGGEPMPPQNHKQHPVTPPVRWKLSVWAIQK